MAGPTTNRSFAGGHFELSLEGSRPAYVKSYDGGGLESSFVTGVSGASPLKAYSQGPTSIKDLTFEVGMASASPVLDWIKSIMRGDSAQQNGEVVHADFNLNVRARYEFFGAWLKEVTFPACGPDSKDMYLTLKVQPEAYKFKPLKEGERVSSDMPTKQKLWTNLGFRLTIDGLDDCMDYVSKIEPFKITQRFAKIDFGERHLPEYQPCGIDIGQLVCTVSEAYSRKLVEWHEDYVAKQNKNDLKGQRTGSLEFLSPSRKDPLFAIQLSGIGFKELGPDKSRANHDQIKRVQAAFTITEVSLSSKGLGIA